MNLIPIIYENEEIIVINKAAGMPVQGGEKIVHSLDRELSVQMGYKIYLVHRLDKDTSGLMIVAKSSAAANKWIKLISSHQVKKEYKAVCIGKPKSSSGKIKENIEEFGVKKFAVTEYRLEKSFFVSPKKKPADSSDSVENVSGKPLEKNQKIAAQSEKSGVLQNGEKIELSLVHLKLETGRMHQIRIHLAKSGCPIAGDDKHGNFRLNKVLRKIAGVKSLLLCSFRLVLPLDEGKREFEIDLPSHIKKVLDCSEN
ncbi:MAG: RluA family pseudouridine synthase [Treponema sp.]|nr:RluA family pseudouridine synthase [Treponema sp.]MDY2925169.1 RluA family pseudouridine synthase [Treponema sp.]